MNIYAEIKIKVIPKSSRSEIKMDPEGNIRVYLTSPPVDGKANAECIKLLSKKLKVPKSNIKIIRGEKSREKRLSITGITYNDVIKTLGK